MMRRTGLKPGKPLVRRKSLRQVSAKRQAAQAGTSKAKRPKDTGPDRTTRQLVLERDCYECFCCGAQVYSQPYSLQHRDARGMGGSSDPLINSPANLITLLGTATSDHCHHRVEQRGVADNVAGYWLKSGQVPADTPVLHWRLGPVLLGHDGGITQVGRAA
ncbi:hypothetical protein [Actinacidiphila oryziradicis]|jgi:hypothetical protein|uniref:HNH endonuclease n=1 Tax=Actinacidiphila oryziradicis TaxID=2571141 RepID=UPI0023F2FCEF|nr:hypothetical protein [Actinacidiphila oryziradicis]MCW2870256.1 hypothetical protein [Actinacidiphila oryziradicis]